MTPEARGAIKVYQGHLARFRALQQAPGSTWTDADVADPLCQPPVRQIRLLVH